MYYTDRSFPPGEQARFVPHLRSLFSTESTNYPIAVNKSVADTEGVVSTSPIVDFAPIPMN